MSPNKEKINRYSSNSDNSSNQQQILIPIEKISLCKEIGNGEFGEVYQAIWHREEEESIQVAVKQIQPEKLISHHSSFLQEAAIMTKMRHENVIQMFGVVLDIKAIMIVSELASCGSLLECLKSKAWHPSLSVDVLCDFALQISNGMKYLSSQRLIHRDLAARNILVHSPSKVKISDFGLSRSLGYGEEYYRSKFNLSMKLPIAWCAPECINFLRFTSSSDVWAYGVFLWEVFTYGQTPWEGISGSQILYAVDTQRLKLEKPKFCPSGVYNLMLKCWEWSAEKRPTFENICNELPTLMPPLLVTVTDCRHKSSKENINYLNYEKGETIILLDKSTSLPGFWLGVSKTGNVGIFLPEHTIAFLGAQNPNSNYSDNIITSPEFERKSLHSLIEIEENKKDKNKKEKKNEKENFKMMISEPKGDLRHTCHVGADGRNFGLLNINKTDLSISSTISPSLRSISPISTSSTFSLAPPRPPKNPNIHLEMSKSILSNKSIEELNQQQQPPELPPKPPRFREKFYKENNNTKEYLMPKIVSDNSPTLNYKNNLASNNFPLNENEKQQEYLIVSNNKNENEKEEEFEEYLRPPSICIEQINKNNNLQKIIEEVKSNENIDLEDVDNCSNSTTLWDCSETKELLSQEKNNNRSPSKFDVINTKEYRLSPQKSFVTTMEPAEFEKRALNERRRTFKQLEKMEIAETSALRQSLRKIEKKEDKKYLFGDLTKSKKEPLPNFSVEAQQAYKLLVECGRHLKCHSQPDRIILEKKEVDEQKDDNFPLTILNPLKTIDKELIKEESQEQQPLEYINSNLLQNVENKKKFVENNNSLNEDETVAISRHILSKLVLPPKPVPPPVPPKPKLK
uniref:non-specific protein-tyrosine kinase n=1 Tax=Meloidogyne incognita TaxID=6306 RepID=A0A914LQW6_MELIC